MTVKSISRQAEKENRRQRILFISFPYFLEHAHVVFGSTVKVEGVDIADWRKMPLGARIKKAKLYGIIYFYNGRVKILELLCLKTIGCKVAIHCIGTDVLKFMHAPKKKKIELRIAALLARFAAVSENLVEELAGLKVKAQLVPFVSSKMNTCPSRINWQKGPPWMVLSYVAPTRKEFYGWSKILHLAKEFPDVEFWILRLKDEDVDAVVPENVKLLGWREDVEDLLLQAHCLLRLTDHDGLPNMVVEALSFGKYVIFSGLLDKCFHADSAADAKQALQTIMLKEQPNSEGAQFALERFSRKNITDGFLNFLDLS